MCGLVGIAGGILTADLERMFKSMWLMDTVRGVDSAGVVLVTSANRVSMDKAVGCPPDVYDPYEGPISDLLSRKCVVKGAAKVLMGHNRAATVGEVTVDTAHPFKYGKVWGMHNGTMPSWRQSLKLEGEDNEATDTMQLFRYLSKNGIDDTWAKLTATDAAALVWWDEEDNSLNMIRNKHRPLFIGATEDERLVWASEPWMISAAAWRAGVKMRQRKGEPEKPMALAENKHLKFHFTKANAIELKETRKLPEPKASYTTYTPPSNGWRNGLWVGYGGWRPPETSGPSKSTPSPSTYKQGTRKFYDGHKAVIKRFREHGVKDWKNIEEKSQKAGKELRGQVFRIVDISLMKEHTINKSSPKIRGRLPNGEAVVIHANCVVDVRKMTRVDIGTEWVITARPRVYQITGGKGWLNGVLTPLDPKNEYHMMFSGIEKVEKKGEVVPFRSEDKPTAQNTRIELTCNAISSTGKPIKVSRNRFAELLTSVNNVCSFCSDPLSVEQGPDVEWLDEHTVLCESCSKTDNEFIREYRSTTHKGSPKLN